jgi:hypothetical protein
MGCTVSRKRRHPNFILDCNVSNRQRGHQGFERHVVSTSSDRSEANCVFCAEKMP